MFGSYEILAPLGAGGMGEVYRARDTALNRDVAIKTLPDAFAADVDRLARFTREAQLLAALNHPNIAGIYGIEHNALVMELVEGDDLAVHIARGPLAWTEAQSIARQIADALEAAHEQGIIHRDLKPQNIKVRTDGTVKILDFGLAKALSPDATQALDAMNSPTLTARTLRPWLRAPRAWPRGNPDGHDSRHGGVHGAGAGARPGCRSPRRHLGVRRGAVRNAHGPAGV